MTPTRTTATRIIRLRQPAYDTAHDPANSPLRNPKITIRTEPRFGVYLTEGVLHVEGAKRFAPCLHRTEDGAANEL